MVDKSHLCCKKTCDKGRNRIIGIPICFFLREKLLICEGDCAGGVGHCQFKTNTSRRSVDAHYSLRVLQPRFLNHSDNKGYKVDDNPID